MLCRCRTIWDVVGAGNQKRQQVVVDEGVLMLEFEVGRSLTIRLHIHRHDDQRAGHFAAPSFNGHLTGDQAIADIDALVLLDFDTLTSLRQPGLPG